MEKDVQTKPAVKNINKPAYFIFLAAGIYFLIGKDFSQAVVFWALAPAFDPFNINVPFQKRPFYQQAWLIVHLSITFALVVLDIIG